MGLVFRVFRLVAGWLAGWLAGYLVVLFYIGWGLVTPYLGVDPIFTHEPRIYPRTQYLGVDPGFSTEPVFTHDPRI